MRNVILTAALLIASGAQAQVMPSASEIQDVREQVGDFVYDFADEFAPSGQSFPAGRGCATVLTRLETQRKSVVAFRTRVRDAMTADEKKGIRRFEDLDKLRTMSTYVGLFNHLLNAARYACNSSSSEAAELFNLNLEFAMTKLTLADLLFDKVNRQTP